MAQFFAFVFFYSLFAIAIFAQNSEWLNFYSNSKKIVSVVKEGDTLWIGTNEGFVKTNSLTGNSTIFNKANSTLPNNKISSIAIDQQGNKWIGTLGGGLVKFDGATFSVFNSENSGLPNNVVNAVLIDSRNNKWIATGSVSANFGGLAKFDNYNWTVFDNSNSGLPDYLIKSLALGASGELWIGTRSGLAKYDGANWQVYNTSNSGLTDNSIGPIVIDLQNNIKWIASGTFLSTGLVKFHDTAWTVYTRNNSTLPGYNIFSLNQSSADGIWVGTDWGLAKFNLSNWIIYSKTNSGLPNDNVKCIITGEAGEKWIGTDNGLAKFDGISWEILNTSSLPNNFIRTIAIDSAGTKWIGTDGGLAKFNGAAWNNYLSSNSGLPYDFISSVCVNYNNDKLIATGNENLTVYVGGLVKYDGTIWSGYNYIDPFLTGLCITAVTCGADSAIWVAGRREISPRVSGNMSWLIKIKNSTATFYDFFTSGLPIQSISTLVSDSGGTIWIGTVGAGVIRFDGINMVKYNSSNSGLPSDVVFTIAIDQNGNKWMGTGNGLVKFDGFSWSVYNSTNSGLPNDCVKTAIIESGGKIWLGTIGGGLAKFDEGQWTSYNTVNSGLPSNNIYSIVGDKDGNKWIGTDNGLSIHRQGGVILDVRKNDSYLPFDFILSQNYPNPFNPSTVIKYEIKSQAHIVMKVYNTLGEEVLILVDEEKAPGIYQTVFNGRSFSSGVYFYTLKAGNFFSAKKFNLLK